MGINKSRLEPIVFHTLNGILMIAIAIVTLYPFVNTLAVSFNAGNDTIRGGIYLWPRVWTDQNYRAVFAG
ncbi:carbohydrate ABC transporter permease, partial [Clostridioides difficile]